MIEINMKMPSCCDECFAFNDYGCMISGESCGHSFKSFESRMPSCPMKDAEPRVLTIEEVACKPHKEWLWFEENVYGHIEESAMVCAQIYAFGDSWIAVDVPSQTHDETIKFDNEYYGKTWRCWSSRPTDEQREATPWTE